MTGLFSFKTFILFFLRSLIYSLFFFFESSKNAYLISTYWHLILQYLPYLILPADFHLNLRISILHLSFPVLFHFIFPHVRISPFLLRWRLISKQLNSVKSAHILMSLLFFHLILLFSARDYAFTLLALFFDICFWILALDTCFANRLWSNFKLRNFFLAIIFAKLALWKLHKFMLIIVGFLNSNYVKD